MRFSVALPASYEGLGYPIGFTGDGSVFVRLARLAESLGYDAVWANDHLVTPAFLRGSESAPAFFEPLTVLAHVAAVTDHIRLGTAVLALPLREPVALAKQVATLDVLSRGRLTLGVGLGAYAEEVAAIRPRDAIGQRVAFDERLRALRMLLDDGRGTFRGGAVHFSDVELAPQPVQRPFPIYVGGHTRAAVARAARWGQGWIPGWRPVDELREWTAALREQAAALGREPGSIEVAPELSATIAPTHEEAVARYEASRLVRHRVSRDRTGRDPALMTASNLVGSPETIAEKVAALSAAGVDHCAALAFPAESEAELTEQWERFAEGVIALSSG
jgi:probable F420-dependent oxidoreductase